MPKKDREKSSGLLATSRGRTEYSPGTLGALPRSAPIVHLICEIPTIEDTNAYHAGPSWIFQHNAKCRQKLGSSYRRHHHAASTPRLPSLPPSHTGHDPPNSKTAREACPAIWLVPGAAKNGKQKCFLLLLVHSDRLDDPLPQLTSNWSSTGGEMQGSLIILATLVTFLTFSRFPAVS